MATKVVCTQPVYVYSVRPDSGLFAVAVAMMCARMAVGIELTTSFVIFCRNGSSNRGLLRGVTATWPVPYCGLSGSR
jgi:hypothetical protein